MPSVYRIIKREEQVDQLIEYCKQTRYACVDFETSGHPFHSSLSYPTILSVTFQAGSTWVIPLAHFDSPFKKKKKWLRILKKFGREVIENTSIVKICHNLKFEYKWFKKYNIEMRGRLFDSMLAKYLLSEERPMDLKSIVSMFLPEFAGYQDDYVGSKLPWDQKPLKGLSKYGAIDTDSTFRLMINFESLLIKYDFYYLFRNMMMMASRVLGDSEFYGIPVNDSYLEKLMSEYESRIIETEKSLRKNKGIKKYESKILNVRLKAYIENIEKEIEEIEEGIIIGDEKSEKSAANKIRNREDKIDSLNSGILTSKKELKLKEPLNFSSPNQMVDFLYESKNGLKLPIHKFTVDKKTKRETNRPSTDEESLLAIQSKDKTGFIKFLLEFRGLTKLYSTYIKGMYLKLSEDKRIHGRFLLHGTVTGRLSSADPNLQNIPRDTTSSDIKKMFIPPPGMILLQLDYSQAELRVIAAAAGETNMIQWFKDGRDIHLAVACDKNGWEYDWAKEINDKEEGEHYYKVKTQRKFAKKINFGIIYGQTAKKLGVEMELPLPEAEKYLREYNARFPKIAKFIKKQHISVEKNGYVRNLFGRKRRLPNIDSVKWHERAEAQRQSVNAPIQGAASDYTLFSSILIWEKIKKMELPSDMVQAYTVHDSLGYFLKPEDLSYVIPILDKICKNPETKEWFGFEIKDVVMKVDFEVTHENWAELHTYSPKIDYVKLVNQHTI